VKELLGALEHPIRLFLQN